MAALANIFVASELKIRSKTVAGYQPVSDEVYASPEMNLICQVT